MFDKLLNGFYTESVQSGFIDMMPIPCGANDDVQEFGFLQCFLQMGNNSTRFNNSAYIHIQNFKIEGKGTATFFIYQVVNPPPKI